MATINNVVMSSVRVNPRLVDFARGSAI